MTQSQAHLSPSQSPYLLVVDDVLGGDASAGYNARRSFLDTIGEGHRVGFASALDDFIGAYTVDALAEALSQEASPPSVILLDVAFGDQLEFGFEAISWLQENAPEIPIVMFTSLEREEHLDRATALGAVDFINKSQLDDELFWNTVLRYTPPLPGDRLIGAHNDYLQAVFLANRYRMRGGPLLVISESGAERDRMASYIRRTAEFWGSPTPEMLGDIDDLTLNAQTALEQRLAAAPTDVMAGTAGGVPKAVKAGAFSKALYMLLSDQVIQIPSLRQRASDTPLAFRRAAIAVAATMGEKARLPSDRALLALAENASLQDEDALAAFCQVAAENGWDWRIAARSITENDRQPDLELARPVISDVEQFLNRVASHTEPYTVAVAGMELIVLPNVFSPRYSHSGEFLLRTLPTAEGARVLDVGCGTGILGLGALTKGAAHSTFIDINPDAVSNVRENLSRLGFEGRGDAVLSDMFAEVVGQFDLIVSNPPFWNRRPRTMLERSCFDEDFRFLRRLYDEGSHYCRPGGRLMVVMSSQSDLALLATLASNGLWELVDLQLEPAGAGLGSHVRIVCTSRRRSAPI